MTVPFNPDVAAVETPPIMEAWTWLPKDDSTRASIDLSQAVPRYPPAPELQAEVARLAALTATGHYTEIFGLPELREALAGHMAQDYGGTIAAEDVAITSGCNQAFAAALMALAGRGTNAILPSPYYFNHRMWLDMLGVEARHCPAMSDNRSHPDPAENARLIDGNTRAIILCSPNNPSGATYPPEVIQDFFDLCQEHGLRLVIDETYKDFRAHDGPPHNLFRQDGWRDTFVQLFSFSKSYAIFGYRAGSIAGGPRLLAEIEKIMDCMTICAPTIAQGAALFALGRLDTWRREKVALMRARAEALSRALARPGLDYRLASAGALFAYVRHPFNEPAKAVAQRLAREQRLLCLPGTMFGPGQEHHLRIAFANVEADRMPEVAARLLESQG